MIGVGEWIASDKVKANVMDVLESGRISYGPYSQELEASIADMHDMSIGVLANSGTSALLVALQAMKEVHGWEDGDEVLVPASTFVATINIVLQCNMSPVLVDVDSIHHLIDVSKAEVTPRTRAIIPVHLFGQPADVRSFAYSNRLKVLEDSCEAIGLDLIGMGDIACFSFYVAHILTTGVGGMAITNEPEYAAIMRSLVNHGRDNIYISIDDGRNRLKEVIGKRFSFDRVGYSYRVTEMESAIGVAQLPCLHGWLDKRRSNAAYLKNEILKWMPDWHMPDCLLHLPAEKVSGQHAWMMFPIVCRSEEDKHSLTLYLEEHGVETRDALPLVTQPVYVIDNPKENYPNAYRLATCGFYVGCHQYLDFNSMTYISNTIREWWNASYK